MKVDVSATNTIPTNTTEAIDAMIKAEQLFVESLHIMISILENPNEMEFHKERIEKFIRPFTI